MALTNAELDQIRAMTCDVVWRIVNRNASAGTDGKLTKTGMKLAAEQQAATYY